MLRPSHQLVILALAVASVSAVAGCTDSAAVVDEAAGRAVIATAGVKAMAESDHVAARPVVLADEAGHEHRLPRAKSAKVWPGGAGARAVVVDDNDDLVISADGVGGRTRTVLLDHVVGSPVVVDERRLMVARQTEPGESDLWIVSDDGTPPKAIAAAPGADDSPKMLPDGRVLFVSGRSGVASLWLSSVDGAELVQLTNRGEKPGVLSAAFRAPPDDIDDVAVDAAALRYTDSAGHVVVVALPQAVR